LTAMIYAELGSAIPEAGGMNAELDTNDVDPNDRVESRDSRKQKQLHPISMVEAFTAVALFTGVGLVLDRLVAWTANAQAAGTVQAPAVLYLLLFFLVAAVILAIDKHVFRGYLFSLVTSASFAVAIMTFLLLATVAGTLIIQNEPHPVYLEEYRSFQAQAFLFMGLDDIFHRLWFGGLLALLALSLTLVPIRNRAWRLPKLGHMAAHLGLAIVIFGGFIGYAWGFKGFIHIREGQRVSQIDLRRNGRSTGERLELPFAVALDDFNIEWYPREYRVYVYQRSGGDFSRTQTIKPEEAGSWIAAGENQLRIVELPNDAGHQLIFRASTDGEAEKLSVEVGESYEVAGGKYRLKVSQFEPDFVYDIQSRRARSRSSQPNNPALHVTVTDGRADGQRHWLFSGRQPGHESATPYQIEYRYQQPVARIEVRDGEHTHEYMLPATHARPLYLDEGRTAITFEQRQQEARSYNSVLAVLKDGRKVHAQTVSVNHPLQWGGYSFHQSNYDPQDPTYSGILVVRDPGLGIVWFGLTVMSLGMIFVYYVRPRLLQKRE
ncbi:MAG: cytochrome c biogenesis protein ResB, partial [Phototrophicaceae bacterium]